MLPDLNQIKTIVMTCAREELTPRFRRVGHDFKQDGSLITEADLATQLRIQSALYASWPEIAFLGEEMAASEQQALMHSHTSGLWVLDPLDGTSNFASGIGHFAVSLAYIESGEIRLGVVYDPERDECFTARKGEGAWLNDKPLTLPQRGALVKPQIAIVDLKRLPEALAIRLATQPPFSSQRSFGSVALDWCWMAAGRAHVYLHGKQNLWDYAAGWLVFNEVGGHSCTLQGEPVFNNRLEARSALAALDGNLFRQWYNYLCH